MNKLIIVCGPTATGKTKLAVTIAREFNGEIVSADSRQIYREMDIGTGKDLDHKLRIKNLGLRIKQNNNMFDLYPYELKEVPLWMVDIVRPDEEFSVSLYQQLAKKIIGNIYFRNKLPIIVGGTGLYINAILNHYDTFNIKPDQKIRKESEGKSLSELQDMVRNKFPDIWEKMNYSDRMNQRRLIRKIEIGNSAVTKNMPNNQLKLNQLWIGLTAPYKYLYQLIDNRVEKRIDQGMIGEINMLLGQGYSWDLPSMSGLGYRQWKEYFLLGKPQNLLNKSINKWKFAEHGFARRQMTWFRKNKSVVWFDVSREGWEKETLGKVRSWYNTS